MVYRLFLGLRVHGTRSVLSLFIVSLAFSNIPLGQTPQAKALGLTSFTVCHDGTEQEVGAARMAILMSQGAQMGPCPEPEPESDPEPEEDGGEEEEEGGSDEGDPNQEESDAGQDSGSDQGDGGGSGGGQGGGSESGQDPPPETEEPAIPTCKGITATIYVQDGEIHGGSDDGDAYYGKLEGTSGADVIVGTEGDDRIRGRGGDDTICGRGGDDILEGGSGNDTICGEAGADEIDGESGDDLLCGGDDDDVIYGGFGDDELDGGNGSDTLDGDSGSDTCFRGEGVNDCTQLADESFSECVQFEGGSDEGEEEEEDDGGDDGEDDGSGGSGGDDDESEGGGPDGDMGGGGGGGGGGGNGNDRGDNPPSSVSQGESRERSFTVSKSGGSRSGSSTRSISVTLSLAMKRLFGFGDDIGVPRHGNVLNTSPVILSRAGDSAELSKEERDITCVMQRNLLRKRGQQLDATFVQWTADLLGSVLGRDSSVFASALTASDVCEGDRLAIAHSFRTATAGTTTTEMPAILPPNTIPVTRAGIPTSSDPVFNQCIQNRGWTKDENGNRINCTRFYNSKHEWQHPDLMNVRFVYNPSNGRMMLPSGFEPVILTDLGEDALRERRHLRRARRVFHLDEGYPLASRDYWNLFFSLLPKRVR